MLSGFGHDFVMALASVFIWRQLMPMCFRVCILTTGGVVLSCIAPVQAQVPYAQADPQLDPLPVPAP